MKPINYHELDYNHKLLYVKSVFEEAQSAHPVYAKLLALLSGQRKIQEQHLDMLYDQINAVISDLHTSEVIQRMSTLAEKLAHIQMLEQQDRAREATELAQMEKLILAIDDDKPLRLGNQ